MIRPAALDQLDAMIGPIPPVDPAQVQREVNAWLLQRGRDMAQDMDLGQQQDDDLVRLAELECIGKHPTLNPKVATTLEMVVARRAAMPREWEWSSQEARHQGHRHAANETCTEDGPGPAPEPGGRTAPEGSRFGSSSGLEHGRAGSATREVPETEVDKRRERYWADLTRDRPEDEWRPQ
jgi:hypothetical protein